MTAYICHNEEYKAVFITYIIL